MKCNNAILITSLVCQAISYKHLFVLYYEVLIDSNIYLVLTITHLVWLCSVMVRRLLSYEFLVLFSVTVENDKYESWLVHFLSKL